VEFEDLIVPCEPSEFFKRYWENSPLVVSPRQPERFASLLSAADVDRLVSTACQTDPTSIELVTSGPVSVQGDGPDALRKALDQGASFRIRSVQQFWQPLHELCDRLEKTFNAPVRANLYSTPPGAQAFKLHFDPHDVLVLQISGNKHWRVFAPQITLPLGYVPPLSFEKDDDQLKYRRGAINQSQDDVADPVGAPVIEAVLNEGDLLYLPRGFIHAARASSQRSVHLTIGIHVVTWLDLLTVALGQAANRNELLRRALPLNAGLTAKTEIELTEAFNQVVTELRKNMELKPALDELVASFQKRSRVPLRLYEDTNDSVKTTATMERRLAHPFELVREDSLVGLVSGAKAFWLPESFAPALKFVSERPLFVVADLPGGLSDRSKCSLIQRLVREGFLRIR
jgi:ribosomal protein L16 Arg81 hydroxylase